jgi:hypothetical protein
VHTSDTMRQFLTWLFFLILIAAIPSYAQPGGGPPPDPGDPVPFTGIEWLIAAGSVLGASKLLKKRFKKEN